MLSVISIVNVLSTLRQIYKHLLTTQYRQLLTRCFQIKPQPIEGQGKSHVSPVCGVERVEVAQLEVKFRSYIVWSKILEQSRVSIHGPE